MKDGLQNVPFDRWLMRVKDITSIVCNVITMLTAIGTFLWIGFKFIDAQSKQQQAISLILQGQMQNHDETKRH